MRGIREIVEANRDAVRQGVVKEGDAVGTTGTKTKLYDVYHKGERIKAGVTIAQCSDIRSIQSECEFKALDK